MPFDIVLRIREDGPRGRAIPTLADAQHVRPEQIIEQILDAGVQAHTQLDSFQMDSERTMIFTSAA